MATSAEQKRAKAGKIAGSGAAGARLAQARHAETGSIPFPQAWRTDVAAPQEPASAIDAASDAKRSNLERVQDVASSRHDGLDRRSLDPAQAASYSSDASRNAPATGSSPDDGRLRKRDEQRAERVQQLVESIASVCGISAASVRVDSSTKMGCRLSRTGIDLMVNHRLNEDIAGRRRFGVRGNITVADVDILAACFVATRAQDYLLDDWCPDIAYLAELSERARSYLQSFIDDLAAYARMLQRIPFARTHFEAYLSRAASHAMTNDPLHLQFLRGLRLYLFEDDPTVNLSPFVTAELGTTRAMSPIVNEVRAALFDEQIGYQARHERVGAAIAKPYERFLRTDERAMGFYDMFHLYDDDPSYGASQEAHEDECALDRERDAATRAAEALKIVTADNIDQLIEDNLAASEEELAGINQGLPTMVEQAGSIAFSDESPEAGAYEDSILQQRAVIDEIADILSLIATPQEQLSVPRYDPRLAHAGTRMHPSALVNAAIQLQSGQERALWQRPKRTVRPQNMHFQGLDIFLLLDVSISMTGDNANNAAAMAVCLVEGLELAEKSIASDPKRDAMDVRTQLIAFGEGWAPLTPLESTHDLDRKRFMHAQLLNPQSEQTLIAEALCHVREHACAFPSRDVLCLVVSDGLFADGLQARKQAMGMPASVYLAHINIGDFSGLPLTEHFETIRDASALPDKLYAVLAQRLNADD